MAYDRKQGGHRVAQANRPDYRLEVGHAGVEVGAERGFSVLDASQAATLKAWVSTLIPASATRPDAAAVGAAEYIDATVDQVQALRPVLVGGIEQLELIAQQKAGRPFLDCDAAQRELLLRDLEVGDADLFSMVRDFTYEAYYGHPQVLAALEADTGWSSSSPTRGSSMKPFDSGRLARVLALSPRWRQA